MKKLSDIIRSLREQNGYLLRQVASEIQIDQALLSKIERNERLPTKEQVLRLAKFYGTNEHELLIAFLSDKLANEVCYEEYGLEALKMAEKKVKYRKLRSK
jgi:transcriptional regulator with XRE-family HTH domain